MTVNYTKSKVRELVTYLALWKISCLGWQLFEEVGILYDLQSLIDIFGILLNLVYQRFKFSNGTITLGDEIIDSERIPVETFSTRSYDSSQLPHIISQ